MQKPSLPRIGNGPQNVMRLKFCRKRPILEIIVLQSSVRVLYMPVDGMPEFREIVGDPHSLVSVVSEGYFEAVPLSDDLVMFCDRDEAAPGFGYSFTLGGHYVHGDAFFVRRHGGETYVSLTDDDVEAILALNI
jgi:hypothetical protein